MTDRREQVALAAFLVIVSYLVLAAIGLTFLDLDTEVRSILAGFTGTVVILLTFGVIRWFGPTRSSGGRRRRPPE